MENDNFIKSISMTWSEIRNYDDIEIYAKKYPQRRFVIDIFPYRILHPDKYDQVSIFYRKLLDREIRKKEFLYQEQKFIYFIKGLWLYNPVNISYDYT